MKSYMNKIVGGIFIICLLVSSWGNVYAQEVRPQNHFDKEAFLAKKNAFITAEMGLTPEEAAAFIPLCNEMQDKMFEVGRECRKETRKLWHNSNATDDDYLKVIDQCVDVKIKEAQLEKEYYEKFKQILPPKKLYKYKHAEGKFAREFMRKDNKKEGGKKK